MKTPLILKPATVPGSIPQSSANWFAMNGTVEGWNRQRERWRRAVRKPYRARKTRAVARQAHRSIPFPPPPKK